MLSNQSNIENSQESDSCKHTWWWGVHVMMLADAVANFASACMQVLALQIRMHLTAAKKIMAIMPLHTCIWSTRPHCAVHARQHEQQSPYRRPI